MCLETELRRVMDMASPWDEAKKKLTGTWVIINKEPCYFIEIVDVDENLVHVQGTKGEKKHVKVETLDTFLPESGLYPLSNGQLLLMVKKPKRQWKKSFSDDFYSYKAIGKKTNLPKGWLADVYSNKVSDIACDKEGHIYFWENLIGRRSKDTIICLDNNFEQELLDWRRNYANNGIA